MDHLLTTMDHFLTSVDRLFAGVLLSTLQKPLPFSDDQAYVLLMCMLFAIGGIVAAQAVFLFIFYVVYFLVCLPSCYTAGRVLTLYLLS